MFPIRPRISLSLPRATAIACMLLSSVSAQEGGAPLQAHFAAAQQAQQEGRLDVAVQEYQQVLRLQPGLPEAYVNLGLVYYAQAKFDESAHALTMAAKLRPGMRGVSLWLGIDDVKLNRPVQGAALLREAIRQDPSEKLAQSWLGTALWDAGQTDAALFQLGKASADFPDDPDLLFARGEAYGKAASQQTEQLLGETSGTALSDLIYGTHYAEVRDWEKAEGHLRRAIERDPHSLDARLELARVLMEQAKLAAAQEQLEQAMAMTPRSAALARSGEVLVLMQQTAEGLDRIRRAFEIDPNETLDALGLPQENVPGSEQAGDALLPLCRDATEKLEADVAFNPAKEVALAALYAQAGDRDAALRAYQLIGTAQRTMSPDASLVAQAREQMHRHRYDDAEPVLLRWLAAHPDDRAARYDLIVARRNISMAQVIRLVTVAPDSYHVHQLLGEVYVSREEDDKALTEYLAVEAARPDLPGVHFWLGH
ncbi:MAG: tetratricopeptide repeat protein, partial [Terracidiphilus sp.]